MASLAASRYLTTLTNTSGGYTMVAPTPWEYNSSSISITTSGSAIFPTPPREKTALEWLREQVDETCAAGRAA